MSATSASKVLVPSAETPQKSLERSALNASVCLFLNASHADFSRLVIVVSFAPDLPDFAGLAWPKQRGAIVTKTIQQRTNCFFITCLYWTARSSSRFFASLVSSPQLADSLHAPGDEGGGGGGKSGADDKIGKNSGGMKLAHTS